MVLSNDLSELPRVAAWVHAWAGQHDLSSQAIERVDLCSTEVVTNIMTHGYSDRAPHQITLRLARRGDDHVALEIEDDGRAFNPTEVHERSQAMRLEDATIGGWGIELVRRFSDEWHYSHSEGHNHSTLIFRLSLPRHHGPPIQQARE